MTAPAWLTSAAGSLRRASVLICAVILLLSPRAAMAQFSQDGPKLVGGYLTGTYPEQGFAVALSADGATAIVGGPGVGASWIFTLGKNGVWTQQGGALVGTGAVGQYIAKQGYSVALSADGNTALVGGPYDNDYAGAVWVFTRAMNGVWSQQGDKLVGRGGLSSPGFQGASVALSADGDTALVGGPDDNWHYGAAWVYTRSNGVWSQQGGKLTGGSSKNGRPLVGSSVALSADGNTAILGGPGDDQNAGAVWFFTRSKGVWSPPSPRLVGADAVGKSQQGGSVALSADGQTAIVGGPFDNFGATDAPGAAWIYTRGGDGVWTQQGSKLVGAGAVGGASQGWSVALSPHGDTAIVGGPFDRSVDANMADGAAGAAWIFTRNGSVWTQQGSKLVGSGAIGYPDRGRSVALSGDANLAIVGGPFDNTGFQEYVGAAWLYAQPLQIAPYAGAAASGMQGGSFSPSSFSYRLSAVSGSVKYAITGLPTWLTASSTSGTVTNSGATVTFGINPNASQLAPGTYVAVLEFNKMDNAQKSIVRMVTLTVKPKSFTVSVEASPSVGGTVSGGGAFAQGSSHSVKATAAAGYEFVHWTQDGKVVSKSASYTFTVEADITLVADFMQFQ